MSINQCLQLGSRCLFDGGTKSPFLEVQVEMGVFHMYCKINVEKCVSGLRSSLHAAAGTVVALLGQLAFGSELSPGQQWSSSFACPFVVGARVSKLHPPVQLLCHL